MKLQKFGEMKDGQWFREAGRYDKNSARVFIKIQSALPSGIKVGLNRSVITEDHPAFGLKAGELISSMGFNSVDTHGVPGRCPDWLEFELLDTPTFSS